MQGSLSRRGLAKLFGAGVAYAALAPAARPSLHLLRAPAPAGGPIRLSANENPYGPSPRAFEAMREAFAVSCRYPDELARELAADLARLHGVAREQVLLGDGSSEILKLAAAACSGPGRRAVVADPTFEALGHYARAGGAEVVGVPLTADFRHDLPKMRAAARGAGVVYLCNPNNPTGSLTPPGEIREFLAALPADVVVVVDEAYHHYADQGGYESVLPQVAERPNLLVARTFSKVYGMAGLRCGYGVGQPALIARLHAQQAWDTMNVMALVAARASLGDSAHIEESRTKNAALRRETSAALAAMGHKVIPSSTNFVMADLGREAKPVIAGLRERGVEVGRFFPALPHHLRVTIGTREEMQGFLEALRALEAEKAA